MRTLILPEDFETDKQGPVPWSTERPNGKIVRHKGGECWLIVLHQGQIAGDEGRKGKVYGLASLLDGMVIGWYDSEGLMELVNGDEYSLIWPMRVEAGVYVSANAVFGGR